MTGKTSAHYQREYRRRLREQGLVKKEVWIRPEFTTELLVVEKKLREQQASAEMLEGVTMTSNKGLWTTPSLFQALRDSDLVRQGRAQTELIEGAESVIHIEMNDYGDLPLYLTVSGGQIIVESLLWPASSVINRDDFNDVVLRTHKYFPLSTVCLESTEHSGDCYFMFGALSSASLLNSVLIEIETLAANVIQVTEAYGDYLVDHSQDEDE
jgi:uncharacterized protein YjfI (DUF2170 family)